MLDKFVLICEILATVSLVIAIPIGGIGFFTSNNFLFYISVPFTLAAAFFIFMRISLVALQSSLNYKE